MPTTHAGSERGPSMKVLFSDGELIRKGGRVYLVNRENRLYVVGQGYICAVDGIQEGLALIAQLRDQGRQRGILIDAPGRDGAETQGT